MIEFSNYKKEGTRQSIITAVLDDIALMDKGKQYLVHVLQELIKQSVIVHRIELENMVTEYIMSPETRKYIEDKIKESIDKYIQTEIEEIFKRDER